MTTRPRLHLSQFLWRRIVSSMVISQNLRLPRTLGRGRWDARPLQSVRTTPEINDDLTSSLEARQAAAGMARDNIRTSTEGVSRITARHTAAAILGSRVGRNP